MAPGDFGALVPPPDRRERAERRILFVSMERFIRLGLEPTHDGFHLHALAPDGEEVTRKLPRARIRAFFSGIEPTLIGLAARNGAPRWAKQLAALGHDVRLLPPGWAKLPANPARRGPNGAKILCDAVARAHMRFAAVAGDGRSPAWDDQADYFAVARRFAPHATNLRVTGIHDLIEGAEQIEAADLPPVSFDDPWFELAERYAANASMLRSVTVDALLDPSETPAAAEAWTGDRPRAGALLACPGPRLGDAPSVKSRDALVASVDAAALARLQELNFASGHAGAGAGDPVEVRKVFRCWRRLRAVAQSGLFLHEYYAYQARVEGSPFTILMHYLNEFPEIAAQPNPLFNTNYYLSTNRGARRSLHPFIEYALYRRHKGATTHWAFSDAGYAGRAGIATGDAMEHCIDHYAAWAESESRSPLAAVHAACDTRAIESLTFDPVFYGRLYKDMAPASPAERVAHYQKHGVGEGRFGCIGSYLRGLGVDNFFVPVDFDPVEYVELNPDIAALNVSPMLLLEHFLKYGLREGRHYTRKAFAVARAPTRRADSAGTSGEDLPVGIFVHMFYPDMWPGISAYLRNMRLAQTRLFVNLVTSGFDAEVFQKIRSEFPDAHILVSPNEGRDIGGLFRLFAEVDFGQFGAVAICHSKKSPHLAAGLGQTWMRDLMDAYADTPENFAENLRTIRQDPHVGIIASAKWRRIGVGEANDRHYKLISSLLPALKGQNPEYPSGTMFLAKPAIVGGVYSALKHLEFENGDGVELKFHIDGQIAHSVERAFGHMARSLGLDILWR